MGISPGACGGADMKEAQRVCELPSTDTGKTGGNLRYNLPTLFLLYGGIAKLACKMQRP